MKAPIYLRLAIGGLVVGMIALQFPGVWGNGYVITNRILHGEYGYLSFYPGDIVQPEALAQKLAKPAENDAVSRYLSAQLPFGHV